MKILIVEDEKSLSDSIADFLVSQNYVCEQATNYVDALERISLYEYDCILLDLMLPDGSGFDLLKKIKEEKRSAGIIIISAKESVNDKVKGLTLGADDYLSKPFYLPELSARIYALIRRRQFDSSNIWQCGSLQVDLLSKEVTVNGTMLTLTRTEYDLLLFFLSNKDKVVSKNAIAEHLTGDIADMLDNQDFIYAHIKNLKAKLVEAGCESRIKNVYAMGYRWTE
ncbi:response regulator transcription factor [uncultured Bacteroides sp.]|uniref:response regulator transcription factor n=1 Tax=uncultured Bacteroides sp. TaxID=162156 RepID=UPI002AAACFB8|nr:response regulator transcription factor [uncultured Bacteroides sp.]